MVERRIFELNVHFLILRFIALTVPINGRPAILAVGNGAIMVLNLPKLLKQFSETRVSPEYDEHHIIIKVWNSHWFC